MRDARRKDGTPLLPHAWVFPVFYAPLDGPSSFDQNLTGSRNNIVLASRTPLDPRRREAAWQRLAAHQPLPGLPTGRWTSRMYQGLGEGFSTAMIPAEAISEADAAVAFQFRPHGSGDGPAHLTDLRSNDGEVVARIATAVAEAARSGRAGIAAAPVGWDRRIQSVRRLDTDWIRLPREVWRVAVGFARQPTNGADMLVGPADWDPARATASWAIQDAPLFTDQKPNADIWNR
jgi:hypothetical protein